MSLFLWSLVAVLSAPALGQGEHCSCAFCHESGRGEKPEAVGHAVDERSPDAEAVPGKTGPWPVVGDAHLRNDSTILVLLSGLGDPRCAVTIANVFTRSLHPERMRVGIVDQNRPADTGYDCVATYCSVMAERGHADCPFLDQIETLRVDAGEARGPAWARAGGAQFVRVDEHDFCLQADAHTDFLTGFDAVLPRMWAQTGNEYAVLSTYVNQVRGQLTKDGRWQSLANYEVPILCGVNGGALHRNTIASAAHCLSRPLLQRSWGAGLSFAKCHFEARVPNDPNLMGIFDGEEFSRMLRAWTHGYDVYTPHRAVVFHDYGNPHFGTGAWGSHNEGFGKERIEMLMTGEERAFASDKQIKDASTDIGYYGLGQVRTVEQYEQFSGMKIRAGQGGSNNDANCAQLRYVPYPTEPATVQNAPLPGAETKIPHKVARGSDKALWPDQRNMQVSLGHRAQGFVLSEMASSDSGHRDVGYEQMLSELGIAIPAHRCKGADCLAKGSANTARKLVRRHS